MHKFAVEVIGSFESDYVYKVFEHEDRVVAEAQANGYASSFIETPEIFISIEEITRD